MTRLSRIENICVIDEMDIDNHDCKQLSIHIIPPSIKYMFINEETRNVFNQNSVMSRQERKPQL